MNITLPSALMGFDISDWDGIPPEDLLLHPSRVADYPTRVAGARALRYARAGKSAWYDEIGFRTLAAAPVRGQVPLQTIPSMRLERRAHLNPLIEEIQSQVRKLQHRPLGSPPDGRYRYESGPGYLNLIRIPGRKEDVSEDMWSYSLSDPPYNILQDSIPENPIYRLTHAYRDHLPGIFWLPLAALIRKGRFERMQEYREELVQETSPGCFYCFLSHRWLSPEHPDPEGAQARFAAWQIVGHLCEAIRVADCRGLNEPRRLNPLFGFNVGISGSDLAESLLVNVLRPSLDERSLATVVEEVESLGELDNNYGVAAARDDIGLRRLNEILANRPNIRALLARIYVWYDYSCFAQPPRSETDERLFQQGLRHLDLAQVLGRTAILLDDTEDYLSRAWCTLESVVADMIGGGAVDLLIGSSRPSTRDGTAEHFFWKLLQDRPHILWRAILDTEVFAVQTPHECMARLGLSATNSADVLSIYQRLRRCVAPQKIHIDKSALVTGVFPLPVMHDGSIVLLPRDAGRAIHAGRASAEATQREATLDWMDVMRVETGWNAAECTAAIPPFLLLDADAGDDVSPSHVAIIGSCEGEAVLLSNWVLRYRGDVERALGVKLVSLSWLSTDIAPIGHIVCGSLQAAAVNVPVWIVVSLGTRFKQCDVTRILTKSLIAANRECIMIAVDEPENNVSVIPSGAQHSFNLQDYSLFDLATWSPTEHVGGLFRSSLLKDLLADQRLYVPNTTRHSEGKMMKTQQNGEAALIREHLLAALAHNNRTEFLNICQSNQSTILGCFQSWKGVPETTRSVPARLKQYVQMLHFTASVFQSIGHPELLESLVGGDDNPLPRWLKRIRAAVELREAGEFEESTADLLSVLKEMNGHSGPAIDYWRPRVLGHLGTNSFRTGDMGKAREYAERARDDCARMGDRNGVRVYRENLQTVRAVEMRSRGSEIGTQFTRIMTEVVKAQDLSDMGRYRRSNDLLHELLNSMAQGVGQPEDYLGKMYGLIGFNYFKLHDKERARVFTEMALRECERVGDDYGVMIYTSNLDTISRESQDDVTL